MAWLSDPLVLARAQFAFTVSFHFIFPAFSIGTANYLAVLELSWLWTRNPTYLQLFDFWKKIFAVAFAMGVVSGITMSYQFGTNWSAFSDKAGPVIGPLMGYEVLSAFFLEAGFLGILLFGRQRVGERLHAFATCMVALGTLISATWIIAVNSWMQTPAGFGFNEHGQFIPENWWAIIFNPSFPYRLVHTVLAAFLTTAFFIGGVGAWYLLRHPQTAAARTMFSMAMWMATCVAPIQILAGDQHGLNTLAYQPAKIAAMEGDYEGRAAMPFIVLGLPDNEAEVTHWQFAIPNLGSLVLVHDLNTRVPGLKDFPKANWPPAQVVFWSFRIMVGMGLAMAGLGLWSLFRRFTARDLYHDPWLLRAALVMAPSGFVAVIAGWVTTEVGRQPFTVYGLLRTSESVAPVAAAAVSASLLAFVLVYFAAFGAGLFYILRLCAQAPDGETKSAPVVAPAGTHVMEHLATGGDPREGKP